MRYRAILVTNEKLPRPVQSFFNDLDQAKKWAKTILEGRVEPDKIQIWMTQEALAANVWAEPTSKDQPSKISSEKDST